jgi:hypothetical protein
MLELNIVMTDDIFLQKLNRFLPLVKNIMENKIRVIKVSKKKRHYFYLYSKIKD